jgi:fructose-specific PTS system IIA-like component
MLSTSRRCWIKVCLLVKNIELRLLDNDGTAGAILEAHRSLATDASLRQHLLGGLLTGLSCQAIVASGEHFCAQFHDSGNRYLQERVLDVRDVCFQLLQHIYGESRFPARVS